MYYSAISKIRRYMDERFPDTGKLFPYFKFKERSYARWAADEITDKLIEEASKLPPHITGKQPRTIIEIIDEVIRDLDYCFYTSKTVGTQEMFFIALDTAKKIRKLFS